MTTELAPIARTAPHLPAVATVNVVDAFLAGRNPRTLKAYSRDLEDFARFVGITPATAAVESFLALAQGDANGAAMQYRADMHARGLSAATISRRLAALRSVVKVARLLGRVGWTLDVESPKAEPYRDTAGPGEAGWRTLWHAAEAAGDGAKARRDRAILRLLHDRALRRGELAGLDLADADLDGETPAVAITGKGRSERERLTINRQTATAIKEWIEGRGVEPGPLFVRLDRGACRPDRLTGEGIRLIVAGLSRAAGLNRTVRPHGLRHASITRALDLTNGNLRDVAKFSRHRDVRVLQVYDDAREDVAGDITRRIGG